MAYTSGILSFNLVTSPPEYDDGDDTNDEFRLIDIGYRDSTSITVFRNECVLCYTGQSVNEVDVDDRRSSWSWWLLQVGTPLIVVVGITGNILSVVVLKSAQFRSKSYAHYLCALAIFDSLVLAGKFMHRVDDLLDATGRGGFIRTYDDAGCKVRDFVEHVCYLMSGWLVMCTTLERFIAVNYPFKKDSLCRPRHAVVIILIVFAVLSYSQIFRLIIMSSEDGICTADPRYRHLYVILHIYFYQMALQFTIPAVVIVGANLSIIRRIRYLRTSSAAAGVESASSAGRSLRIGEERRAGALNRSWYRTTGMLLLLSFSYVFCLFPLVFISMFIHVALLTNQELAGQLFGPLRDIGKLFEFISELNYAANFYIYVMSGLQFRRALCRRFSCHRRRRLSYFRRAAGPRHRRVSSSLVPPAQTPPRAVKVYQFRQLDPLLQQHS